MGTQKINISEPGVYMTVSSHFLRLTAEYYFTLDVRVDNTCMLSTLYMTCMTFLFFFFTFFANCFL